MTSNFCLCTTQRSPQPACRGITDCPDGETFDPEKHAAVSYFYQECRTCKKEINDALRDDILWTPPLGFG